MFTGLIEEIGVVRAARPQGSGIRFTVEANRVTSELAIDDSVALAGVCQTVVARSETTFEVEAVAETLLKTTLGEWKPGKRVNMERALKVGSRLGGHFVQGHADTRGKVESLRGQEESRLLTISFPERFARYVIPVGSICIDGVSLTAARVTGNTVTAAIIPHTWAHTTLNELREGSSVNLEFDVIGKYIERLLHFGNTPENSVPQTPQKTVTAEWLASLGY